MRQNCIRNFLFIVLLGIQHNLFSQDINSEIEKIIKNHFSGSVFIKFTKYEIPSGLKSSIENEVGQKFYGNFVYLYSVKRNGQTEGYAIADNVSGKSLPITFLVVFNDSGVIKSTDIIRYREQYGGAVRNKKWNEQFIGRNYTSSFETGKDISAISGATISVNSVSKGVRKLSILIKEIINFAG